MMTDFQQAPGYAMGAAQQPVQRPMVAPKPAARPLPSITPTAPTVRPDMLRPPVGGPGTAAPPVLSARAPGVAQPQVPRPMISSLPRPQLPQPNVSVPPQVPQSSLPSVGPTPPPAPPGGPPPVNSPLGQNGGVPLTDVGSLIQQQLASPTRFDLDAFKKIFDYGRGELQNEASRSRESAIADASRRGAFYSSVPDSMTGGMTDIGERYNRGLGQLASDLTQQAATTGGNDFNSAIGNAFRYLENQQQGDQFAAQLGLNSANLGYGGAPNVNEILAQISGQPLPQAPQNPLEGLGSLLPLLQSGTPGAPGATPPKPAATVLPTISPLNKLPGAQYGRQF